MSPPPIPETGLLKPEQPKVDTSRERGAALIGQFVASIILIIAITVMPSATTVNWAYGVSVGSVAGFFSLVGIADLKFPDKIPEKVLLTAPVIGDLNAKALLTLGLGIWWGVGMGILTFQGPFTGTNNGYFSVWFGFACSVVAIGMTLPKLKDAALSCSASLLGLAVCALVVGLEICLGTNIFPVHQTVYGLIVSVLTLVNVIEFLIHDLDGEPLNASVQKARMFGMLAMWGILAPWLTFTYPFSQPDTAGNGYYASWAGLACVSKVALDKSPTGAETKRKIVAALENERHTATWGMFVAGIVILADAAFFTAHENSMWGYALAVGIVATAASVAAAMLYNTTDGNKPLFKVKDTEVNLNSMLTVFLFIWWGVAAGILTIENPYTNPGNGYFATWVGFGCSIIGVGVTMARVKETKSTGLASLIAFGIAAIVLLIDICPLISKGSSNNSNLAPNIFSLVVAILSILWVHVVLFMRHKGRPLGVAGQAVYVYFFILWTIQASWCTFAGPFKTTGNGYFASWSGVLSSIFLAIGALFPLKPQPVEPPTSSEPVVTSQIYTSEQAYAGDNRSAVLEDGPPAFSATP